MSLPPRPKPPDFDAREGELTIDEAARLINVCRERVNTWARTGKLPYRAVKFTGFKNSKRYFQRDDVLAIGSTLARTSTPESTKASEHERLNRIKRLAALKVYAGPPAEVCRIYRQELREWRKLDRSAS